MCAGVVGARALLSTRPGRQILWQGAIRSPGYSLFRQYTCEAEAQLGSLAGRFAKDVHARLIADESPQKTQKQFAEEVKTTSMELDPAGIERARSRMASSVEVQKRIDRILDSKFVKMTLPVLNALYDSAATVGAAVGTRQEVVEGHIIAIDLSEPMDRIVDLDEDPEYLDDYRLLNPHILGIARSMIARGGEDVLASFESGFAKARAGQLLDEEIQADPARATESDMNASYEKYRAVMGTAGRNMAAGDVRLGDTFYAGMAHAAECVGCGNELEDSVSRGSLKIPSWALFECLRAGSTSAGLDATRARETRYMAKARAAFDSLPSQMENAAFLEFLFLTIDHYNLFWHAKAHCMASDFDRALDVIRQR